MGDQNGAGVSGVVAREVGALVVFSDNPNCLESSGVKPKPLQQLLMSPPAAKLLHLDIVSIWLVNQIHTGV